MASPEQVFIAVVGEWDLLCVDFFFVDVRVELLLD